MSPLNFIHGSNRKGKSRPKKIRFGGAKSAHIIVAITPRNLKNMAKMCHFEPKP